ncbi:hypothetical protein [Actinophytocola sp. KF-1]
MTEGGRQASIGGVWARVALRYCAVGCWLTVVAGTVMVFTVDMPWWAGVLTELALLLIMLPLGFVIWSDAAEHKADTERLLRAGRAAVAEITDVEVVTPDGDSADVHVLTLRISGEGVPEFEARYRCDADKVNVVGARLRATVDPADNLFTLQRL